MLTKICTHSGSFHSDEVLAVAMLQQIFPIPVERTRDEERISQHLCDPSVIVVDVGKVYDPIFNNFDHHQSSFNSFFCERSLSKMSSFGLVYKHYGMRWLEQINQDYYLSLEEISKIYRDFYLSFVLPIDAHDNGVRNEENGDVPLQNIISSFNSIYLRDQDKRFAQAVNYAAITMKTMMEYAFERVSYQNENRKLFERLDYTGPLLVIPFIFPTEPASFVNTYDPPYPSPRVMIIIHQRSENEWVIRARSAGRFTQLKKIICESEARRVLGEREKELKFVHTNQFIAFTTTKEAALQIAEASLNF